jgi:hypothetical protein
LLRAVELSATLAGGNTSGTMLSSSVSARRECRRYLPGSLVAAWAGTLGIAYYNHSPPFRGERFSGQRLS